VEHAVESTKQNERSPARGRSNRRASIEEPPLHPILQLQRQVGNQAVLAMLRSGALQAKLKVGAVDDPLEHEADRVADQVMRMPGPGVSVAAAPPQVSRKCAACEEEEKLQKKPAEPQAAASEAPSIVHEVLRSPGQPLDAATRTFFEPRFGRSFEHVRVHADADAAASARAMNALAYTIGRDIIFADSHHQPRTNEGRRLLAHELAHVVQQRGSARALQRQTDAPDGIQTAPAEPDVKTESTQPGDVQTELASHDEAYPGLSALVAKVEKLEATVAYVTRDQGVPPPGGRTEIGGETVCDPDTGKPKWTINRDVVPKCMWPCAETHEQTHAEFLARPCEEVGLAFGRISFWIRVAKQYAKDNKPDEAARAVKEAEATVNEAEKTVAWYKNYMEKTCRYDEGTAYAAGIEACDTDEARKRCTAAGQSAEYGRQMAAWRRFMQTPPNCPNTQRP
jgi:hypothetical protein